MASLVTRLAHFLSWSSSAFSFVQSLVFLPLALDIAGRSAFLLLSFSFAVSYFVTATIQLLSRNTRFSFLSNLATWLQLVLVPGFLLLCLNLFSSPLSHHGAVKASSLLKSLPGFWAATLRWCSPLFALLEAISTVVVIQAAGQISTYFVEEKSESYQFLFLLTSATTYVVSAWNLYQVYGSSAREPINATLIGCAMTTVFFLTATSFALRRGSVVEASLMLSYTVLNIYYISSEGPDLTLLFKSFQSETSPLPPSIIQSFTAVVAFISHTFGQGLDFISAAASALPLPVLVGLVYRIAVMYLAGSTLLAWKRGKATYDESVRLSEEDPDTRLFTVVLRYSRFIMICVYTHLLLLDSTGHQVFWRWFAVFSVQFIWAVEILLQTEHSDNDAVVRGLRLKRD